MNKLIALLLTLAMALCIAMPAFAADEAQTETIQTDLTEPMDLVDTNESEIPKAQEETDEQEQSENIDEEAVQEPIEEYLDYFGYVKKHFQHGADKIREYLPLAIECLPAIPVMFLPFWGTILWGVMTIAFVYSFAGIGEILFSPIIAAIDISQN